jgi:hypothetical protein
MQTAKKYGLLSTLLAAVPSYASSITGFTFTPNPSSTFTTSLSETFTSSEASLTGTVGCPSLTATFRALDTSLCTGDVGFGLEVDLNEATEFTVEISGDLSGTTAATGDVLIKTLANVPFSVNPGSFDDTLVFTTLPAFGLIELAGALDLTLARGQEITLPLTLSIAGTSTAVPEPSGQVLLLVGLLGIAGVVRYRIFRTA